jgi:carbamoyl-phosphate synthase small subunit
MVCLTYPLIGNYGVNPQDMESEKVHMAALLVKECCKEPSNWRATESLPAFLMRHGVPGIEGMSLDDLYGGSEMKALLSVAFSLLILLPALFQLHLNMKKE